MTEVQGVSAEVAVFTSGAPPSYDAAMHSSGSPTLYPRVPGFNPVPSGASANSSAPEGLYPNLKADLQPSTNPPPAIISEISQIVSAVREVLHALHLHQSNWFVTTSP